MKGSWLFFAACAAVGVGMPILMWWWPAPNVTNVTDVVIVAICRDGSRIYRREDGTHYARIGFNRFAVPNPETVCK